MSLIKNLKQLSLEEKSKAIESFKKAFFIFKFKVIISYKY